MVSGFVGKSAFFSEAESQGFFGGISLLTGRWNFHICRNSILCLYWRLGLLNGRWHFSGGQLNPPLFYNRLQNTSRLTSLVLPLLAGHRFVPLMQRFLAFWQLKGICWYMLVGSEELVIAEGLSSLVPVVIKQVLPYFDRVVVG